MPLQLSWAVCNRITGTPAQGPAPVKLPCSSRLDRMLLAVFQGLHSKGWIGHCPHPAHDPLKAAVCRQQHRWHQVQVHSAQPGIGGCVSVCCATTPHRGRTRSQQHAALPTSEQRPASRAAYMHPQPPGGLTAA